MGRIDPRVLVLLPVLLIAGGCGDDEAADPPPVAPPASSAPAASVAPSALPEPAGSAEAEGTEDADPPVTQAPGDLSDQAQGFLDEALGRELGALEGAPAEAAAQRREVLDRLPEDPAQVLTALKNYVWYSPEARALYDKAVAAK